MAHFLSNMIHIPAINRGGKLMATRVTTTLVDDVDGTEAQETVAFGLDGSEFEIDLSDSNATKLRDALAPWVSKARKTGGRRSIWRKPGSEVDNKAVRVWAQANGIGLSKRGRIPADVVSQFKAAGN
jgi:Lsr2